MTLDTRATEPDNPYEAHLSALVDTWQRRFNLELQRALAAESRADEDAASIWHDMNEAVADEHERAEAAESLLAETREALERLTAENESMWEHVQHEHLPSICRGCGDKWPCPTVQARAFLGVLSAPSPETPKGLRRPKQCPYCDCLDDNHTDDCPNVASPVTKENTEP